MCVCVCVCVRVCVEVSDDASCALCPHVCSVGRLHPHRSWIISVCGSMALRGHYCDAMARTCQRSLQCIVVLRFVHRCCSLRVTKSDVDLTLSRSDNSLDAATGPTAGMCAVQTVCAEHRRRQSPVAQHHSGGQGGVQDGHVAPTHRGG